MHGFSSIYSFSCRSQCGCVSDFYFWRIRAKEAVIMTMFFWTKSGTEDSSTCILAWQIPGWPATEVLSFACNWCFSRHGDVAFSLFDQQYLSLKFLNWGPLVLWVWNTIRFCSDIFITSVLCDNISVFTIRAIFFLELIFKLLHIIRFYNVKGLSETTCLPTQGRCKVCVHSTLPVPDHTCRITQWVCRCLFVVVSFFFPVHFVYRKWKTWWTRC